MGIRIAASYAWYNFRVNRLAWHYSDNANQLSTLHRRNARLYARFAAGARGGLVKLGQLASARADIMPIEFIEELAILQDCVVPASFSEIEEIVRQEFGKPIQELFSDFNPEPIGAASLGQVHEARLHDGRKVAVKVQYKNIKRILSRDFDMLHAVLPYLQPLQPRIGFISIFREFRRAVLEEIDYRKEAENCRRIRKALATIDNLTIPEVIDALSSERVLTMTFVEGYKVVDVDKMNALQIAPADVMKQIVNIYCEQIFVHGLSQTDPQPGNLFFSKNAAGELVIGLIDFGQVKEVSVDVRNTVLRACANLLAGNVSGCTRALCDLGFVSDHDLPKFTLFVESVAKKMGPNLLMGLLAGAGSNQDSPKPEEGEIKQQFKKFLEDSDGIKVPPDIVLYGRTFALLTGMCARIAPELKLFAVMMPYLMRALQASNMQDQQRIAS